MVKRVAHVPGVGHHSRTSAKALAKTLDALMRIYPAAALTSARPSDKSLLSQTLPRDNSTLEIKARRFVATRKEWERPAPWKSLVAARRKTRVTMEFHHPSDTPVRISSAGRPG